MDQVPEMSSLYAINRTRRMMEQGVEPINYFNGFVKFIHQMTHLLGLIQDFFII